MDGSHLHSNLKGRIENCIQMEYSACRSEICWGLTLFYSGHLEIMRYLLCAGHIWVLAKWQLMQLHKRNFTHWKKFPSWPILKVKGLRKQMKMAKRENGCIFLIVQPSFVSVFSKVCITRPIYTVTPKTTPNSNISYIQHKLKIKIRTRKSFDKNS